MHAITFVRVAFAASFDLPRVPCDQERNPVAWQQAHQQHQHRDPAPTSPASWHGQEPWHGPEGSASVDRRWTRQTRPARVVDDARAVGAPCDTPTGVARRGGAAAAGGALAGGAARRGGAAAAGVLQSTEELLLSLRDTPGHLRATFLAMLRAGRLQSTEEAAAGSPPISDAEEELEWEDPCTAATSMLERSRSLLYRSRLTGKAQVLAVTELLSESICLFPRWAFTYAHRANTYPALMRP